MKKMYPVKYTRKEYRQDYLQTEEWKRLRAKVIHPGKYCQKCRKVPATDVHHMNYRHIVDVGWYDLMALCRECHDLVHDAIDMNFLRPVHKREDVAALPLERIKEEKALRKTSQKIPIEILAALNNLPSWHGRRLACGILKILMPADWTTIGHMKVCYSKIQHLRWLTHTFTDSGFNQYQNMKAKARRQEGRKRKLRRW